MGKRIATEKKLKMKVQHLELRVNTLMAENRHEDSETAKLRSAYAKQKKKMADVKKYMQTLPTRPEYEELKRKKKELETENKILTNELRTIKTKITDHINGVQDLKRSKDELEKELEGARDRIIHLESKSIPESLSDNDQREIIEDLKSSHHQLLLKLKAEKNSRLEENQTFEKERAKLTGTITLLEQGLSETQAEVATLKTSNEEITNKLTEVCGDENVNDIKKTLAENIDILDGLVRRILSYQTSIDESDDEDFNITHSEFRQSILHDKNRTMNDLNAQMKSIRASIDDIEANLASQVAGQACQVQ